MLRVPFDLERLTAEQLEEAERTLHHDATVHPGSELERLFVALECALHEATASRCALEERHRIALALGIDERTGEWMAGA